MKLLANPSASLIIQFFACAYMKLPPIAIVTPTTSNNPKIFPSTYQPMARMMTVFVIPMMLNVNTDVDPMIRN